MEPIRKHLEKSQRVDSGIGLVVAGVPVYATKSAHGESFVLQVAPPLLGRLTSPQAATFLTSNRTFWSQTGVVVGQFVGRGGRLVQHLLPEDGPWGGQRLTSQVTEQVQCVPTLADPALASFVLAASESLDQRLANMGRWESFAAYLRAAAGYDPLEGEPRTAPRPSFRWLIGLADEGAGVLPIAAYERHGIYITAEGYLPIYSSHLQGSLAGDLLGLRLGKPLLPDSMECCGLRKLLPANSGNYCRLS